MSKWDELEAALKEAESEPTKPEATPAGGTIETAVIDREEYEKERNHRLASLASRLFTVDSALAEFKDSRKNILTDMEALVPEELSGTIVVPGWEILVERGERWSWDKEILEQILAQKGIEDPEDMPPFVSKSTTIKRDKFDRQPEEVRREYMPALTRMKGATKITIKPTTTIEE